MVSNAIDTVTPTLTTSCYRWRINAFPRIITPIAPITVLLTTCLEELGARCGRDVLLSITLVVRCDDTDARKVNLEETTAAAAVVLLARATLEAPAKPEPRI